MSAVRRRRFRAWPLLAAVVLAIVLAGGGAVLWQLSRDPLAALPRAGNEVAVVVSEPEPGGGRVIEEVTLSSPALGSARIVVSLPDPLPVRRIPVVVVLGGLGSGRKTLGYIPDVGDNALVGYDWPIPRHLPAALELLREAPGLYRRALVVPGQVAAAMRWLADRPWADRERISLLGFSLGAHAAPAVQRLAAAEGVYVGWTILAYGGTPIGEVLAGHPRVRPDWARPLLGIAADLLLRPVEPAEHLPHLTGRFLVLTGDDDSFIPAAAAARLEALTPEPRTVVRLGGGHMGVGEGQEALLEEIIRTSRDWLAAEGAINPY